MLTGTHSTTSASESDALAHGIRVLLGVLAFCLVMPAVLVSNHEMGARGPVWLVFLGVVVWAGLRLSLLIADGRPALFHFVFWLFTYVFMGLGAMAQFGTGRIAYTTPRVTTDYDTETAVVVVLGVAAFEIGSLVARRTRDRRTASSSLPVGLRTSPRLGVVRGNEFRSVLLVFGSAPICAYYVMKIGIGPLFSNRQVRFDIQTAVFPELTVSAVIAALSWVPALVALHRILGARVRGGPAARLSTIEIVAVAMAIVMIVLVNNPISSSRYGFGSMALSFLPLFGAFATIRRSRRSFVLVAVSLLVAFPMADAFRNTDRSEVEFSFSFVDEYPENPDYDTTAQLHNAIRIVHEDGVTWARQPLGVALFWVPRSIWPDKPIDTGNFIAEQRHYDFLVLSAPLWAELYLIAGWFSVVVGFAALGWVLVKVDRRTIDRLLYGAAHPLVASFIAFYGFILLRGSLLQAMAIPSTYVAAAWFSAERRAVSTPAATAVVPARNDDDTEAQRRVLSRWTSLDDDEE